MDSTSYVICVVLAAAVTSVLLLVKPTCFYDLRGTLIFYDFLKFTCYIAAAA
jgi:hypothetical protein